jgi:hypothetical protein
MAKVKIVNAVAVGLEYYSAGSIVAPVAVGRAGALPLTKPSTLNLPGVEVKGVGEGFTEASNAFVAKVILGYAWERDDE